MSKFTDSLWIVIESYARAGIITCCIVLPLIFFTAYVNGGNILTHPNYYGEAVIEAWIFLAWFICLFILQIRKMRYKEWSLKN